MGENLLKGFTDLLLLLLLFSFYHILDWKFGQKHGMEGHVANLQHICRICKATHLGDRSGRTTSFQVEILAIYKLDITLDNPEIHPQNVCFSCLKKLYLARNNKQYRPQDISVAEFIKHVDNKCLICEEKQPQIKRRGRPSKKRGGKRIASKEINPEISSTTSNSDKTVLTENCESQVTSAKTQFETFGEELFALPLGAVPYNWCIQKSDGYFILTQVNGVPVPTVTSSITISADRYTVYIHNRPLPENHELYNARGRQITNLKQLSTVLDDVNNFSVCCGNFEEEFVELIPNISPCKTRGAFREENFGGTSHKGEHYSTTVRSTNCSLLISKLRCDSCIKYRNTLRALVSRKYSDAKEKDTAKVNYKYRTQEELTAQIITEREKHAAAIDEIGQLRKKLDNKIVKEGIQLDASVSNDLKEVINSKPDLPFPENSIQKLFWEQQIQAANASNPRLIRWHPSIIKLCLNLNMTSSKAYNSLAKSGIFKLPSTRTLQDYTHYIKVRPGLQMDVIKQMTEQAKKKGLFGGPEWKRYVVLLIDEMKIKQDLVFDKHTGEIIGFTNLGAINEDLKNTDLSKSSNVMATHMMATMVRSVCADFKFQLSHYPTTNTTAGEIFPIVWEIVEHLELRGFKVLAITCDGASINRRLFKMHRPEGAPSDYLTYSTTNPFALDERPLFFIADAPHLLKTTRNCWSNSYSHKMSRKLWVSMCLHL